MNIYKEPMVGRKMLVSFEKIYPIGGGVIACIIFILFGDQIYKIATLNNINIVNIFAPVFDLSTFIAGSLFTVYALALSPSGSFIEKIFRTKTFGVFHIYVSRSIILNFLLSILSVMLIVYGKQDSWSSVYQIILSIWIFLFFTSFLSVIRVVSIFLIWVGVENKSKERKVHGQST